MQLVEQGGDKDQCRSYHQAPGLWLARMPLLGRYLEQIPSAHSERFEQFAVRREGAETMGVYARDQKWYLLRMFNLVDNQLSCVLTIAAKKSAAKMVDRGNSRRQVPQAVGRFVGR